MPRGRIKNIVIGIFVVVAVISIGLYAYLYFTTDLFKSDKELFGKYIRRAVVNVEELLLDEKGAEYNNLLENNKYNSSTEITADYMAGIGTTRRK